MKAEIEVVRGDLILGTLPEGEAAELLRIGFFHRDDRFRREGDPAWRAMAELLGEVPSVNRPDLHEPEDSREGTRRGNSAADSVGRPPRYPLRRPAGERAGSELARARLEPGEVEQSPVGPVGPSAELAKASPEPAPSRSGSWLEQTRQSLSAATNAAGSAAAAGVGAVSNAAGVVAGRLRSLAGDAPSAVSKSTQSLLEGFLPQIRTAMSKALAKAGDANTRALEAVRAGVRDDDFMRKTFGAVYDCLPKPVCRFVNEEKFIAFCLEHRKRLLE